jgi:hypothetical protein
MVEMREQLLLHTLRRSLEQIMSRTTAFLDAISFSRIYGAQMVRHERSDEWAWRVDAQLAELVEAVWAAEKTWRVQDRIEGSMRYGLGHEPAKRRQLHGENDH